MGRMRDMIIEIQDDIEVGELSFVEIAAKYGVTLADVDGLAISLLQEYDYMDGDNASALASAGFGTDEDYGYADCGYSCQDF